MFFFLSPNLLSIRTSNMALEDPFPTQGGAFPLLFHVITHNSRNPSCTLCLEVKLIFKNPLKKKLPSRKGNKREEGSVPTTDDYSLTSWEWNKEAP